MINSKVTRTMGYSEGGFISRVVEEEDFLWRKGRFTSKEKSEGGVDSGGEGGLRGEGVRGWDML